ncbi:MAG TPA: hypothetical protein VMP08_12665 [Anaerolineae bacterium]|nr:hypothetical protein [Anaerolineae bacterium]
MKTQLKIIVMLSALLLAACSAPATVPSAPTQRPSVSPTQAPSVLPTQAPSVLPTQPPSPLPDVTPGGGLATRPEADVWKNAPAAALSARADLVQRLQIDPDKITLVSVEQVDWPDGCLGVQTPGMMCTMVITPGYRVILEADGKQYEYHTNESGSAVRLATLMP